MFSFLLWCLLFVICWPLALLALVLWPLVWLITLPLRLLGIAVDGAFALLLAVLLVQQASFQLVPDWPAWAACMRSLAAAGG